MAQCCGSGNNVVTSTRAACSRCGSRGAAVHLLTAKALLTEIALRYLTPAPLYFCQDPTCSVVYFTTDGQVYTSTDVRVPVWQKEPAGSRRICYCFDENEASMLRELVETGRCGAVQRVRDHIAANRCACEVRNPRGTCCLGDLMKAVTRLESDCIYEVEKYGMASAYRISEVAQKAGVTPDTIRYYERLGVLPRPPRTAGGLRAYGDDVLPRVRFIQQAQSLGLTLRDVKELVVNEGRPGHQRCRRVRDLLKTRLADVDARLREMQAFRRTLRTHLNECERALEQDTPVCPVMIELGARGQ